MRPRLRIATLVSVLAALPASAARPIPPSLKDLVIGARHRPIVDARIAGVDLATMPVFHDAPFLLWPEGGHGGRAALPKDRTRVEAWLGRAAEALGHGPFRARYLGEARWRQDEVWVYELRRGGVPLHDGRVRVHWDGPRLVGIENHMPGPVVRIDALPSRSDAPDLVYFPARAGRAYELVLATAEKLVAGDVSTTTFASRGRGPLHRITASSTRQDAATFTEYAVPVGSFPDQIDVDSAGNVWFSQPNDNLLTRFDPIGLGFVQYPTTGGSGPDGMIVDGQDRVWTGLYFGASGMGRHDIATSGFTIYPTPYTPSNMAIPLATTLGTVWVTDHQNNRISELDPSGGSWL